LSPVVIDHGDFIG